LQFEFEAAVVTPLGTEFPAAFRILIATCRKSGDELLGTKLMFIAGESPAANVGAGPFHEAPGVDADAGSTAPTKIKPAVSSEAPNALRENFFIN
jgi:hypothetical protein